MATTATKRKDDTCAACDCKLDASVVQVTIGDYIVGVCCEECAQKLRQARGSARMPS